jgi:phage recombination protein Bet
MNEIATPNMTNNMKKIIKDMYFPKSTDEEFKAFLFDAQAKGLDPLQKEIIPIQFKGKTTTVVSRDGYVKKAKQNPDFLGYRSQPIYENDEFTYEENNEGFVYSFKTNGFKDRGALIGAFCHVKMKDPIEDTFALVSYKEVRMNTPVWKSNPTFMTQKVAEVRALKPICNLSGIVSDVELGENINSDEGTEDEINEETVKAAESTSNEKLYITSQEQLLDYFLDQRRPEGFNRYEIKEQLDDLMSNKQIDPKYYEELIPYCEKMDETTRLYGRK